MVEIDRNVYIFDFDWSQICFENKASTFSLVFGRIFNPINNFNKH